VPGENFMDTGNIPGFLKEICIMKEVIFVRGRELL
jgi:hypothetical protein